MVKKMLQLDYACKVGERVWWSNLRGERFEGVILEWNDNIATLKLDDETFREVEC